MNVLRKYFPMLRTRTQLLEEIHDNEELNKIFNSWEEQKQEEFLDFCTGAKGIKMLYDFCVKAILNPEIHPERMEELISLLLGKKVKLLKVLPNDNTRISDETSLLVMDFLVQLKDGSVANVEIQDMHFPDRGALAIRLTCCYGSIFKFVDKCRKNRFPTAKFQMFILLFCLRKVRQNFINSQSNIYINSNRSPIRDLK